MKNKFISAQLESRVNLVISVEFLTRINGENSILADDGTENRILIFGIKEFSLKICSTDSLYSDGTFYSVPRIFLQLYTMHGFYKGEMIPFIYSLLPNKTEKTYRRFLRILQDKASEFNSLFFPRNFLINFELAFKNAIQIVLLETLIHGCLFHFTQALIRNIQTFGLTQSY
jgi:hypothetical protein